MKEIHQQRKFHQNLPLLIYGLALAVMIFNGCGKKAPPVAPRQAPLVAVDDLLGDLSDGSIRLTWHHTSENAKAKGYVILRAQTALREPACQDCPQIFQKVATVPVSKVLRKERHAMEYDHVVSEGFRYTFSVRPYQSSGAQGPDSNLVVISHEKAKR